VAPARQQIAGRAGWKGDFHNLAFRQTDSGSIKSDDHFISFYAIAEFEPAPISLRVLFVSERCGDRDPTSETGDEPAEQLGDFDSKPGNPEFGR
jgi:hypothetical protein